MVAKFVAAIDHGTTSTRCILFDELGAPIATAQRGQSMHYPMPGWVELDMEEVWTFTRSNGIRTCSTSWGSHVRFLPRSALRVRCMAGRWAT